MSPAEARTAPGREQARARALANRRVIAVGITVLVLDQLAKRLAVEAIPRGGSEQVLPVLDLVNIRNDGVAFSSFAGQPWIVGLLVVGALTALTVWFVRNRTVRFAWLAAGMLAGGAMGNVLDRLIEGAVIDFLKPPRWPAFNTADMAIVGGMVLLVIVVEIENRRTPSTERSETRPQRG